MSVNVNQNQHGNPILNHIIQVPYNIVEELSVDFAPNQVTGMFFLSLSYHRLHPEYVEGKLKENLPFKLKILLLKLDVGDYASTLKDLYVLATQYKFKCMVGSNIQECGSIIEQFCIYANKPADFLMPRTNSEYLDQVQTALTSIKGVNKSDALTLITNFKSISKLAKATKEELAECPGIADVKIHRILGILNSKLS